MAAREGEDEPILVAHVAAESQALHAWQLRQHMLDQFHTQPGAAVPHRFTIVDAPPAGEKDVDAWERQTVIEDGDGTNLPAGSRRR